MKQLKLILVFFCFTSAPLYAATMLESMDRDQGVTRIWINDNFAHLDVTDPQQAGGDESGPQEILVDLKNRKIYGINHSSKLLIDMSSYSIPNMPHPPAAQVKIALTSQGHGPTIAGFKTEKYLVSANGAACFTSFMSKDVLKHRQLGTLYDVMASMPQPGSFSDNPCESAEEQIDKLPKEKYGISLKTLDKTGGTIFEVKQIKDGVNPPSNYLQKPAGYKTMSMEEWMQQMQGQMQMPTK